MFRRTAFDTLLVLVGTAVVLSVFIRHEALALSGHVCQINVPSVSTRHYSQGYSCEYKRYYSCGIWGWQRCQGHRYKTCYRLGVQYYTRYTQRDICCEGWADDGTGNCSVPICTPHCRNGGVCTSPNKCTCVEGFQGDRCQQDIDECLHNGTLCEQICVNIAGSYTCACRKGFTLRGDNSTCEDIVECAVANGGCEHNCTNTAGSFYCSCRPGYALANDSLRCFEINECKLNKGGCGQNCFNTDGSFYCTCEDGYLLDSDGKKCNDLNECSTSNGGCSHLCTNIPGSYYCGCPSGYELKEDQKTCQDTNECSVFNGGCDHICTNSIGSFKCSCRPGSTLVDGWLCDDGSGSTASRSNVWTRLKIPQKTLPHGCFSLSLHDCGPDKFSIKLSSTSNWYSLKTDPKVKFTKGVVFIELLGVSVIPVSITGVEIETGENFKLSLISSFRDTSDGNLFPTTTDEGCNEVQLTIRDVRDIITGNAFLKTLLDNLVQRIPSWLRLSPGSNWLTVNDLKTSLLFGRQVDNIPMCTGGPIFPDRLYSVFQFNTDFKFSIYGNEVSFPKPVDNTAFCLIIDICNDYGGTIILMMPPESRKFLGKLQIFQKLKDEYGLEFTFNGIGLSLQKHLNAHLSTNALRLWKGDQFFTYRTFEDANLWFAGGMVKKEDNWLEIRANAELFVAVPHPLKILTHIFLDEWNLLFEVTSGLDINWWFEIAQEQHVLRLKDLVLADAQAYMDMGGTSPRKYCAPGANPPGVFVAFDANGLLFRDVPFLEEIFSTGADAEAYAMLTYEPSENLNNLPVVDFLNDIIGVENITKSVLIFVNQTVELVKQNITTPAKALVDNVVTSFKTLKSKFEKAAVDIQNFGFPNLPDIMFSLQESVATTIQGVKDLIDGVLYTTTTILDNFLNMIEGQIKRIENLINSTIRRLISQLIGAAKDITGVGIKAHVSARIFGLRLAGIDIELVYDIDQLARCGKYKGAYELLDGQRAVRILGVFSAGMDLGFFFKGIAGGGLGMAIGIETTDAVLQFRSSLNLLGVTNTVDVFVDRTGISTFFETKVFDVFRARVNFFSRVLVPFHQLKFRVEAAFLAGGDDSYEGSFLDALKRFANTLASEANRRLTNAQRGLTIAQDKLTGAQRWLQSKKADVDKGHAAFDAAIAGLETAKQKVEQAKGPFQAAIRKLESAQRHLDRLCRIRDCSVCVPGIKCRWCKKGWFRYPCCRWTGCMFRIQNPICVIRNAACYVIRGIAYVALEIAKLAVRTVLVAMDIAKAALSVAQFIVDKSRVVLELAKLALDAAILGLEATKGILEAAKHALEVVKFAVRIGVEVFNFIVTYTIQALIDVKRCGFAAEVSTKDVFIVETFCDINFFRLGWREIRFRINFKNIFQSIWEAAKTIVTHFFGVLKSIFTGRRRREIEFEVNSSLHKLHRLIRQTSNGTDSPGSNFTYPHANFTNGETIDVTKEIPGFRNFTNENLTQSDDYEYRVALFKEKCQEYTDIDKYLTEVAQVLFDVANDSKTSIDEAEAAMNMSFDVKTTVAPEIENITLENSGVNITDAQINYNLTEEELKQALDGADLSNTENVKESNDAVEWAKNASQKDLEVAKNFPLVEVWLAAMENLTSDLMDETKCASFKDCLLVHFSAFYQLYDNVDIAQAETIRDLIPEIESRFVAIISNGSITLEEAVDLSGDVLRMLNTTRSAKVFCASPPVLTEPPKNTSVLVGEKTTLKCLADGDPSPQYMWFEGDNLIPNATEQTLILAPQTIGTATYECIVGNHVANLTSEKVVVSFEEPPSITADLEPQTVYEGLDTGVSLVCNATGLPEPNIQWCYNHSYIKTVDDFEFTATCMTPRGQGRELRFTRPKSDQQGWYWCKAENQHGQVFSNAIFITVKRPRTALFHSTVHLKFITLYPQPDDYRFAAIDTKVLYKSNKEKTADEKLYGAVRMLLGGTESNMTFMANFHQSNSSNSSSGIILSLKSSAHSSSMNNVQGFKSMYQQYRTLIQLAVSSIQLHVESESYLFQHDGRVYILDRATFAKEEVAVCEDGYELDQEINFICSACLPGTYYNSTEHGWLTTKCQPCPKDMYQDDYAGTECVPMPIVKPTTETPDSDDTTLIVAVTVSVGAVLIICLVVLVVIICRRRLKKAEIPPSPEPHTQTISNPAYSVVNAADPGVVDGETMKT